MHASATKLTWKTFDPQKDDSKNLHKKMGNYLICLKNHIEFPACKIAPLFTTFEGKKVIYTGIASKCLLTRDYKQHFTKCNAGQSTLRKSLGVIMGFKQIPRDKVMNNKTKFELHNEMLLSDWMINNLILYYAENLNYSLDEDKLILQFNPPLNLKKNYSSENIAFRKYLSSLRNDKS
ncbi:GIY-YIG nuclease family protein [Mucilaginibacter sp.]|uniref:GIY-YIG nuclease family protein n=1 Tax=Mucilaginibacter sp. TaxID=1882438 RepID=UPI0035BBD2E8